MSELVLRNRQRARRVNTPALGAVIGSLLRDTLEVAEYELGVHLVSAGEITRINESFLRHAGPTDVITFDYAGAGERGRRLQGEVFVCLEEALIQARRFRTTWQSELVRYVIHGILHLRGFDDARSGPRRIMKREENRLLREMRRRFRFSELEKVRVRA